ncbi:MAG TPA: fibrillarin-like rRNA/tRNA 2'-O-methyltransferase, partial [Nitrosopumilus sp.]|nr:fibrillarin-like rRNA/tRNA 2'-O-methyltransferase [Nitrosopumilus sp.]
IKTRSIDVTQPPRKIIKNELKKLQSFKIIQQIDLHPYDKDHAMIIAKYLEN